MLSFSLVHILCYHLRYHLMLSFIVIISPLFSFSWKRDTLDLNRVNSLVVVASLNTFVRYVYKKWWILQNCSVIRNTQNRLQCTCNCASSCQCIFWDPLEVHCYLKSTRSGNFKLNLHSWLWYSILVFFVNFWVFCLVQGIMCVLFYCVFLPNCLKLQYSIWVCDSGWMCHGCCFLSYTDKSSHHPVAAFTPKERLCQEENITSRI
jgi:hypothetical protein